MELKERLLDPGFGVDSLDAGPAGTKARLYF